jgi:serine/threonine protein kinase
MEEVYERILSGEAELPESVSTEAQDFIRGCLELDPAQRMTARQMLSHPWLVAHHRRGRGCGRSRGRGRGRGLCLNPKP